MALRLKIDAIDAEVKNLEGSFAALSRFASEAREANGKWRQFLPEAEAAEKTAKRLEALYTIEGSRVEAITQTQSRFNTAAGVAGRIFSNLARESKAVAGNLLRITYSFMNLGLMTTTLTGLLGLGIGLAGYSFMGLENSAARMSAGRRSALGLGANFGGAQSFGANFGRFVDSEGFMGNVAQGRYDLTSSQRLALMVAGIDTSQSTDEQAAQLLEKVPSMLAGTPEGMLGARAGSLGLLEHLSLEEIVRVMRNPAEVRELADKHRKNKVQFDVPPAVLTAWAEMSTQLERAAQVLEGKFAENLSGLAKPLSNLSESFVDRVKQIIESHLTKESVEGFASGVKRFAAFLSSEDFLKCLDQFTRGVEALLPYAKRIFELAGVVGKGAFYGFRLLNPYDPYGMPGNGPQSWGEIFGTPGTGQREHLVPRGTPRGSGGGVPNRPGAAPRDANPSAPSIRRGTRRAGGTGPGQQWDIDPYGTPLNPQPGNTQGLRILPGHGATAGGPAQAGLVDVGRMLQAEDPTLGFTALNDAYHQHGGGSGHRGPHARGRAFDAATGDIEGNKAILRRRLGAAGFQEGPWGSGTGDYSIEPGTGGGTGPHLHFQWNNNDAARRYHDYVGAQRHENNRRHFGTRGRQRPPANADFRDNLADAAHTPKRVTVINETSVAVGHGHVYG